MSNAADFVCVFVYSNRNKQKQHLWKSDTHAPIKRQKTHTEREKDRARRDRARDTRQMSKSKRTTKTTIDLVLFYLRERFSNEK